MRTSWIRHLPIPLKSADANRELLERLRKSGPDWIFITARRQDGSRVGYASNLFLPDEASQVDAINQFLLFDIHSSIGGWSLSHLWRIC
jgi:hypothetical protein